MAVNEDFDYKDAPSVLEEAEKTTAQAFFLESFPCAESSSTKVPLWPFLQERAKAAVPVVSPGAAVILEIVDILSDLKLPEHDPYGGYRNFKLRNETKP